MDCADRVIAEVPLLDTQDARLAVLLSRYESLIHEERFVESRERDAYTPGPPPDRIWDAGRIRLAMSFRQSSTSDLLTIVLFDFRLGQHCNQHLVDTLAVDIHHLEPEVAPYQ